MKSFTRCLFFIVAFMFISAPLLDAELYFWTDGDGVTHYSDTEPPVEDQKYKTMEETESESGSTDERAAIKKKREIKQELDILDKKSKKWFKKAKDQGYHR